MGPVAGGGVETDIGLVEEHERSILGEYLRELGQAQVCGRQVEGVGLRVEAERGDGAWIADELPHCGLGKLVGGATATPAAREFS
ncbi:hypothetical protein LAN15_22555, partial [Mycobacterium tuberculosis]|nr:hypothetical protein [Mycobacterium tuberculosis]